LLNEERLADPGVAMNIEQKPSAFIGNREGAIVPISDRLLLPIHETVVLTGLDKVLQRPLVPRHRASLLAYAVEHTTFAGAIPKSQSLKVSLYALCPR
jgi:hypothetical protein